MMQALLKTASADRLGLESAPPIHLGGVILLTDLLTAAMDNPGCSWTRRQSATAHEQAQLTSMD